MVFAGYLNPDEEPERVPEKAKLEMPEFLRGFVIVLFNFVTSIMLVNSVKCLYKWSDFNFPLFIASTHMVFAWIATAICLRFYGASIASSSYMAMPERIRKILPFTVLQAASIAASNLALMQLYPSFHEMIQSLTPIFTLITSILFDGKRYNCWAYVAMIPVCGGGAICSFNEVNFSVVGVVLSISAVVFRALKTLLQGRLLCDQKVNSIVLCYYMAPFNFAIFATASVFTEGLTPLKMLFQHDSFAEQVYLLTLLTASGVLACAFNILSYLTIKHLSPLGANVIANAKTPAIIFVSMLIFGNPVKLLQIVGLLVTFFGIFLHGQKGHVLPTAPKE